MSIANTSYVVNPDSPAAADMTPVTIYLREIVDQNMDDRLYYHRVRIVASGSTTEATSATNRAIAGGYKVYGIRADGSEQLLGENAAVDTYININDTTDQYDKIVYRFNTPVAILNDGIRLDITAYVKPEVWEEWKANPPANTSGSYSDPRTMKNEMYATYTLSPDPADTSLQPSLTATGYNFFRGMKKQIYMWNSNNYSIIHSSDNTRYMTIETYNQNWQENFIVKNLKHIALLPPGVEFVSGSTVTNSYAPHRITRVVNNFQNTGKTAVIFEYGDVASSNLSNTARTSFKINATIDTPEGVNTIEFFTVWDNNSEVSGVNPYTDSLDLDNDGDTTEKFLRGANTIAYSPPRSLVARKFVGTSSGTIHTFESPYSDIGDTIWYRLVIDNNSLSVMNSVTALDVLPYAGDHSIVPNAVGEYPSRGSEFAIHITQALEDIPQNAALLAKWDILYSTAPQGDTLSSARDASFVPKSDITDFSKVTMIKLVLKAEQTMAIKETSSFLVEVKIPADTSLQNYQKTVNSLAVSQNGVQFAEGNKVVSSVIRYEVQGNVFGDVNSDTNRTDVDIDLSGYEVRLFAADGTPATDIDGNELITTTDTSGYYHFDVIKRGNYYVKFIKKQSDEQFTDTYSTTGTTGNDTTQDSEDTIAGKSEILTLSPTRQIATRNAGLLLTSGIIRITKTDDTGKNIEGVQFQIEKNPADGTTPITVVTNASGSATVNNLEF